MAAEAAPSVEKSANPSIDAPGPRATTLRKLYADATSHVLKTCSYRNFSSCFPTPAETRHDVLRDLHKQFTTDLGRQMQLNFDVILEDNDVVQRLNELDRLIIDAKRRRAEAAAAGQPVQAPTPPHSLPARELYLAHLAPSLGQMSAQMKQEQDDIAAENVQLLDSVMEQRLQIKGLVTSLEITMAKLETAATALSPDTLDELRDEVRNADEETRST